MDIKRCFEILELTPDALPCDIKQAYKDIVNVWHPDRFSNNPRLRLKAEEKLKEINYAYEVLNNSLSYNPDDKDSDQSHETDNHKEFENTGVSRTESIFETGTFLALNLFSQISSAFRQISADIKAEIDKDDTT
jgi:curved DNA-binding protein CbpA